MAAETTLITGANGFVGRYLIRQLLAEASGQEEEDKQEIAACVLPSELAAAERWAQVSVQPTDIRRLRWYAVDLTLDDAASGLVQEIQPHAICHLAARASGADTDREAVFRINVDGTRLLLQAASVVSRHNKTLLISTGYAYGDTSVTRPARESDPLADSGKYGAYTDSKIAMEHVASEYADIAVVARSFSHTGPGQTAAFAVPSFARQLARISLGLDPPYIKVGNLEALRDMLDVRDVVRAYGQLLQHGVPGKTYNVATGKPHRMLDILDQLRDLATVPTQVELDPDRLRPADIACSTGDSGQLQSLTGWAPEIPFKTTLQDTLDYWRNAADPV